MKNKKILISIVSLVALAVFLLLPSSNYDMQALNKELESNHVQNDEIVLNTGSHSIDETKSKLTWEGKKVSGTSHTGSIKMKNSNIEVDVNGNISGNIIIDMKSINNKDLSGNYKSKLESHLKSQDFFDVNRFETGQISFNSVARNNNKITFEGDLTIKDITHPVSFDAFMKKDENDKIMAKSVIIFDRAKYDVRYGSGSFFENLGDNMIADDIKLDVEILVKPSSIYTAK